MESSEVFESMGKRFKPYAGTESHTSLPKKGLRAASVLKTLKGLQLQEEPGWRRGYASGAVYHGESGHIAFANRAYSIGSQSNPLHPDIWPSLAKFEGEMVGMTSKMLSGGDAVRGAVTSGGTESILLAMKTSRDWAKEKKGITDPEVVLPVSAHAAFDKACHYFGLRKRVVPLGGDFAADLEAVKGAVGPNTAVVVGSAPCFPYGVVDDIKAMSEIAADAKAGFHTDACLGGFILPWARRLGYRVPAFDFELPGVTSMSVDTHKYGYAPKGTSVVLYSDAELFHHQYYIAKRWPGGIYFSTTMAGSRPGGLIAAAWATMLELGEEGYLALSRKVLRATERIRSGIGAMDGARLLGDSLMVAAFDTKNQNVYQVTENMSARGWFLNGLQNPPGVHIAVTLRHAHPRVTRRFLSDLRKSMKEAEGAQDTGLAPVYGMAGTMPEDSVTAFLESVIDWMYLPS